MNRTGIERADRHSADLGRAPGQLHSGNRLISVAGIAEQLGVCTRTVHRLVAAGELPPAAKVGRASRWFEADVAAYLERLREERGQEYGAPDLG